MPGAASAWPYARYGETVDGVVAALEGVAVSVAEGLGRHGLQQALPPGAARNALDCAYWDLAAKQQGVPVWRLAGLVRPASVVTAYTLSLDSPVAMAAAARAQAARPLLKLKLAGADDLARVEAVRASAPAAQLIVDANEAWTPALYSEMAPALAALGSRCWNSRCRRMQTRRWPSCRGRCRSAPTNRATTGPASIA